MNKKKYLAILSAAAVSTVLFGATAMAAEGDVYDLNTKQLKYEYSKYSEDISEFKNFMNDMILHKTILGYEHNGKVYQGSDLLAKDTKSEEEFKAYLVELEENSSIVKEDVENFNKQLTVTSVSAINQTIASNDATELKFLVNGTENLTAAEFEAKYKGYIVAFKYNVADKGKVAELGVNHAKGEVTTKADNGLTTFKYAVEVTDAEGNKVNEAKAADFVDVKVTNAIKAVKVTEVQLQKGADKWENSTVTDADAVKIVPSVYENALGQKNTDKKENSEDLVVPGLQAPTIETATSSAPTVAYYNKANNVIKVLGTGEVTFTVKFEGIEGTHQVKVNALDEQKATSIKAEAQKVKAETAEKAEFVVLDQNAEAMRGATDVFYTLTKKGDVEVKDAVTVKTDAEGKASLDVNKAAGEYIVNVYTTADKKAKLGSFAVEAINVKADAKIDEYKFEFAAEKVTNLDINPANGKTVNTLEVKVTPYVSGIEVAVPDGVKVKSSDNTVFTVDFKADSNNKVVEVKTPAQNAKAGKANIVLYTEEGDLITELKTFEVEVKNTAPQYETLTLKASTKVDGNATDLEEAVIAAVKEEVTEDQIEKVTPLKDDDVVLVKMKDAFGGKTIQLAAEFVEAKLTGATLTPAVKGEDEVVAKDAVAAKAKVGEVDFEAVTAGKAGNNISVVIKQGEATKDSEKVDAAVSYADNKLTVTLGATWDGTANENAGASKLAELKVSELKELIEADNGAKAAIKVATSNGETVVSVAEVTPTPLKDGADEVVGKEAVVAKDGKIVLTFSEAVVLGENVQLKIGNDTFKNTIVLEDGKTVTADVEADKEIKATDKVNVIEGIKPVKGALVIPEGGVEVKAAN